MNPTQSTNQGNKNQNLFEGIEALQEFEKAEVDNIQVTYNEEHKQLIRESWESFYTLKSSDIAERVNESPVSRVEIQETIEDIPYSDTSQPEFTAESFVEKQKSSSILDEAGIKLDFPLLGKEVAKGLFGAFGIFKEIFTDTLSLFLVKKDKKAEKIDPDPKKAEEKARKKAENQRKQYNIRNFYDNLKSLASSTQSNEIIRMDTQEKARINLTAKIGQESYKGIKDAFGRLTIYAASMLEKAQLDQEKRAKKQEKEMKIASISKGPDLNMDKVAEGGFLSSTGGQGAG